MKCKNCNGKIIRIRTKEYLHINLVNAFECTKPEPEERGDLK